MQFLSFFFLVIWAIGNKTLYRPSLNSIKNKNFKLDNCLYLNGQPRSVWQKFLIDFCEFGNNQQENDLQHFTP